jgi:dTDP-L-rhamnose 4-epimerase
MSDLVVVTGGCGFIGSHTVHALLERDCRVRILDNYSPRVHRGDSRPPWLSADVEVVPGDVRDPEVVEQVLTDADIVVHLAAYQDYLPDVATFFDVNVTGTARLYEAIIRAGAPVRKIVVASSQSVYGEGHHRCPEHGTVSVDVRSEHRLAAGDWDVVCPICQGPVDWLASDESSATRPTNAYGASKLGEEQAALTLGRRYGIPTTCLRYSITNGRWQSPRNAYSGICRTFVQQVMAGRPPVLFEDGLQMRDYCAVGDVVAANLLAIDDTRTDFGFYNVGGTNVVTVRAYAGLVMEVLGSSLNVEVPGLHRYGDTRHAVSSSDRLRRLGWAPVGQLRDVIADYAEWLGADDIEAGADPVGAAAEHMLELGVLRRSARGR